MSFDFDLTNRCNHIVDGIQYWGFDVFDPDISLLLQTDGVYRNLFLKRMAYRMCPRCGGKGWYYDIHFDKNDRTPEAFSSPLIIRGRKKLKQEITKFLITVLGDNPFHPLYGVGYQEFIGNKITPETFEFLDSTTRTALDYLKSLYAQQKTYQNVDPAEMFIDVEDFNVNYEPLFPTAFFINATVVSEVDTDITTDYVVSIEAEPVDRRFGSDISTFVRIS